MYNKESCRCCGSYLSPYATCSTCKEYVRWICNICNITEDVIHSHNYCTLSLGRDFEYETIIDKSAVILASFREIIINGNAEVLEPRKDKIVDIVVESMSY
jgi:hypothetical protein